MSAIPVPTVNINALYTNTTSGTDADPQVMDNAIIDIVSTINANATEQNNNTAAAVLPHADGSVTTAKLADLSVTTAKMAASAVTTAKLADANVTTAKIADSNVTLAKMADASVGTAELVDLSVTTAKIAIGAVGVAQLSPAAAVNETVNNALIVALSADVVQRMINVKHPPSTLVAAVGDGTTDDTVAINAMVQYVKTNDLGGLYFPDATYMIKATGTSDVFPAGTVNGGIIIDSPMSVILHPNATLKAITGNKVGYIIVNIRNTTDVLIQGGKIVGERDTHIGTTGEFGHGISIIGCQNVRVRDTQISNCWGDGIDLGYGSSYSQNFNIHINGVTSTNNRRQGLSIVDGRNIYISKCEFSHTNGTAPQFGIDIEPDGSALFVENVFIDNCLFDTNTGGDIALGNGNGCKRINITNNICKNSTGVAVNISKSIVMTNSEILVANNNVYMPTGTFFAVGGAKNVTISDNIFLGTASTSYGLYLSTDIESLLFADNQLSYAGIGIVFTAASVSKIKIKGNTFSNVGVGMQPNVTISDCDISDNKFHTVSDTFTCIYARFTDSIIERNKFYYLQGRGLYGVPIRCRIRFNEFYKVGLADTANSPAINIDGVTGVDNLVEGNVFLGDATSAISSLSIPNSPNTFIRNIARYAFSPFNIEASNIAYDNMTSQLLTGTFTYDPGSLVDGAGETKQITVLNLAYGDFVLVSAPYSLQGITVTTYAQTNFLQVRLQNETGGTIDLASGTWKYKIIKN